MSVTVKLASGHDMPLVGFGLWKVDADKASDLVYEAIKAGYRLFDGAYDYANEVEAGKGIQRAISEGIVKREDIFVTTKLWNTYHKRENALKMAKEQNEAWGLGYIDLYLIHFPVPLKYVDPSKKKFPGWYYDEDETVVEFDKAPYHETWQALEEVVDSGIAKSIGVSNVSAQTLYDVQTYARHPVSSLQIEHHPYLVQPELIKLAQQYNVQVTAYSTFGPQSFYEMPPIFRERGKNLQPLFETDVVQAAAKRSGKTPGQVLLRWATQRGIAVIPKSTNPDRIKQNLDVTNFDLTQEELDSISSMDKGIRFIDPGFFLSQPIRIFA